MQRSKRRRGAGRGTGVYSIWVLNRTSALLGSSAPLPLFRSGYRLFALAAAGLAVFDGAGAGLFSFSNRG